MTSCTQIGKQPKLRAAAKPGVVLETISLMRRIALTGTDEDKAAAEQILGSAKREVEKAEQHKEE